MPALAFLLGTLTLMRFSYLPALSWLGLVLFLIAIIYRKIRLKPALLLWISFYCAGFFWADFRATLTLEPKLPLAFQAILLEFKGSVEGLPIPTGYGTHLLVKIHDISSATQSGLLKSGRALIQVKQGSYQPGDEIQCQAAFLPFHGLLNRGGLNEEDWAFEQGVNLSGTANRCEVLRSSLTLSPTVWMNKLRYILLTALTPCLPHFPHAAWLMALMIGEHRFVDPRDWAVLNDTGTNHLMAIGGLHLGMVALWANAIVRWLWRRFGFALHYVSVRTAGFVASIVVGFLYAVLSGFSLPAERAFLMLLGGGVVFFLRRDTDAWQCLSAALLMVLIVNPASVISASFWLSFMTIACLCLGLTHRPQQKNAHLKQMLRVQGLIGLGLLPITLWYFQRDAMLGSLSNLIAIPWLIFTILPLCLLAMMTVFFSSSLAHGLLSIAGFSLNALWHVLGWCTHLPHWTVFNAISHDGIFITALFGVTLLLLPKGTPMKSLGIIFLLPVMSVQANSLPFQHYRVSVLDVGQGLSVLIQTRSHVLLYDTGARLSPNSDEGARAVVPTLMALHLKKIDMLVVSHGDNDHAGGVNAVLAALPVHQFITSVPALFPKTQAKLCEAGQHWRWDGVDFLVLSPAPNTFEGNNASCVLRVSNGHLTTLLPGDIQAEAEAVLMRTSAAQLLAEVLIAPHHGSETSSSLSWIQAVSPRWVVYSTGFHNRYHLPNAQVVKRYQNNGVNALNTVTSGEIDFDMGDGKPMPATLRNIKKRFWFDHA